MTTLDDVGYVTLWICTCFVCGLCFTAFGGILVYLLFVLAGRPVVEVVRYVCFEIEMLFDLMCPVSFTLLAVFNVSLHCWFVFVWLGSCVLFLVSVFACYTVFGVVLWCLLGWWFCLLRSLLKSWCFASGVNLWILFECYIYLIWFRGFVLLDLVFVFEFVSCYFVILWVWLGFV